MNTVSTQRLFQATWSLVAVYFSILLADIARNALVPIFLTNYLIGARIWIVFPTILMFIISAFEGFLWLNPKVDKAISMSLSYFMGVRLTTYFCAILAQIFLLEACTNLNIPEKDAMKIWGLAMASVIGFYSIYNILGIVWPLETLKVQKNYFIKALWVYIPFVIIFLALALMYKILSANLLSFLLAFTMILYFIIYFTTFKEWFKEALSYKE